MTGRGTLGWSRILTHLGIGVAVAGVAGGLLLLGAGPELLSDSPAGDRWVSGPIGALASALTGVGAGGMLIGLARLVVTVGQARQTRRRLVQQSVVFQQRAEVSAQECRRLREEIRALRSDAERYRTERDERAERVASACRHLDALLGRLRGR